MRAHYLQHVPFEGLGSIETWFQSSGYEITSTRLFESVIFPELSEIDVLVVMGGPMSVNDEQEFGWLVPEKRYIREAVLADTPVLGVCLGAQLIANAMGAPVYRNHAPEIGWFPVQGILPSSATIYSFSPSVEVFHWHGDTFDLPSGAIRLARSHGCANQAFQLGRSVLGLQFHLEVTPESVRELVTHCRSELTPSKYVQPESTILSATDDKYRVINNIMDEVLCFLTKSKR